jgi:hypothetical protein
LFDGGNEPFDASIECSDDFIGALLECSREIVEITLD